MWGDKWGENGYVRVAAVGEACGLLKLAAFATLTKQ